MANREYTLGQLAAVAGGELTGDAGILISGVAGIREAQANEITFISNPKYARFVTTTRAGAIILDPKTACPIPAIRLENPYMGYLLVLEEFAEAVRPSFTPGIHPSAEIAADAVLGEGVSIGPHCQVESGARIGDNTTILCGSYVGQGATLGEDCFLHPNVTVQHRCEIGKRVVLHSGVVIGSDGFGFAPDQGVFHKIPQIGIAILEDDVEIGSNTTIDRASVGVTRIGQGTKIDNLCQIGHNCVIGKNTVIAAMAGFGGSTTVGDNCMFGAQTGSTGHLEIGDRVIVAARGVPTSDVPSDTTIWGFPATEYKERQRVIVYSRRLPEMHDRLKALEKKISQLEEERD